MREAGLRGERAWGAGAAPEALGVVAAGRSGGLSWGDYAARKGGHNNSKEAQF